MRIILLISLLLLSLVSCGDKDQSLTILSDEEVIIDGTEKLIRSIEGEFSGCSASLTYSGYYALSKVSVSNEQLTILSSTHSAADCSDEYGYSRETFEIVSVKEHSDDSSLLDVNLKTIKYEFYPTHSYYPSQNYCGIVNMAQNIYTDLSGLNCPVYLDADPFHSNLPAAGSMVYTTIKIVDSDTIQIINGFSESGDTDADRKVSDFFEVKKI